MSNSAGHGMTYEEFDRQMQKIPNYLDGWFEWIEGGMQSPLVTIQDITGGDEVYCRIDEVSKALIESGWFLWLTDEVRQAISEFGVRVAVGASAANYETYLGVRVLR